jgi:hypothetical protein
LYFDIDLNFLVDESKLGASADLFIKGAITSEAMKAKLRHAKTQVQEDNKIRDTIQASFESFRSYLLLIWMLTNGLYVSLMTKFLDTNAKAEAYVEVVLYLVIVFTVVRAIGAVICISGSKFSSQQTVQIPRYPKAKQPYPV